MAHPTRIDVHPSTGVSSLLASSVRYSWARGFRQVLVVAVIVAFTLTACGDSAPEPLMGMVRIPPPNVGHVVLPAVSEGGRQFATKAEPGHLLVVYFGYTACPDICPTTMSDLRRAVEEMASGADLVDVAFITVDPERDVPERLTNYIQTFFEDGIALRTEDADVLAQAATDYGASYDVVVADDGIVEVAHSAFLYAVDETGVVLVQWPFGMTSDHMRSDLENMVKGIE